MISLVTIIVTLHLSSLSETTATFNDSNVDDDIDLKNHDIDISSNDRNIDSINESGSSRSNNNVSEDKDKEPQAKQFSPKRFKMVRLDSNSTVPLTEQVSIPGGSYYFGSQTVSIYAYWLIAVLLLLL